MPGRGRPQSLWWSHFEMVGGDILKVCWYLHYLSTFRWLPTGKMPALQQTGEKGQGWVHLEGSWMSGRAGCPVAGCPIKLDVRKAGCPVAGCPKAECPKAECLSVTNQLQSESISNNQNQSASIRINQHQLASSATSQHQSASVSINQHINQHL